MQDINAKYNLDLNDFFAQMDKVSNRLGTVEDSLTGMRRQNPFVAANQSATQFNTTLGQQVTVYQKIEATAVSFRQEQLRLKQVYTELKAKQMEFIAAGRYDELTQDLDKIKNRLKELKTGLNDVVLEDQKLGKGGSGGKGGIFGGGIGSAVGQLTSMIGVSFGVAEGLRLMVTESAKFGKGLSELSALTGVTGKDLEFLADAAVDLETKTGIAATDIVEGFKLVGGIKPELLESKEALSQVTNEVIALSQASGISLQDAATSAVGALNQFGEGADQAGRFVNVLAAGAKLGASEVNDTSEALKSSGTAMKAAGLSFEQGNAVLQSLAGVMIKGAEAGTGLRNVLLKLETDTDKNLRPSVVGLDKALENAAKKYDTTTELTKVFGVENIVAARRILDTREEISKLTTELTGTSVAYEQQRTNLDNLSTDLSKAGTATIGFFRDLGQSQDGFLRKIIQGYTGFLQFITNSQSTVNAFFTSLFDRSDGGIGVAFQKAAQQYQNNNLARSKTAEIGGIKSAATQSVADDTKALAKLYQEQGDTVPAAQKKAIQKVKEQNDQALTDAQANHARLRKEFEGSTADQKKYYDDQFAASRRRILAAQTAKKLSDSEVARQAKDDATRAATLKSLLNEPASDADKKAGKAAQKAAEDNYKLLLSAQEEYVKEYTKLETEFGKAKLEALKKDENAYLLEKAKLDKAEVDAEQAHLLKLLQLAASNKTRINKSTGQREVVADQSVTLPADIQKQFDDRKKAIDAEADRQIRINRIRQEYELLELGKQSNQQEIALYDKKWEGILASETAGSAKYLALVKKRDSDRQALVYDQIIRDQKAIESIRLSDIAARSKNPNETGQQFNKRNQLDELATQQFSAENQIEALQLQDNPANNPEIARLNAYVKAIKDKRKEIELLQPANRDIWDLLGVSKSFKDDTERQVFLTSVQQITDAIQQTTQIAVQASDERIQALDAQIQAKQEQVGIEEERDKEGYANNLALRQQELEDLKRQKAEEEATKRKALAVQQTLDLAAQVSNNAVTVSNTVTAISEMFKQYGKIPLVGVFLALGAIATIVATIASVKAKAKALTQLKKGGLIPLEGRSHEQGGHRIEGTDIEVERGEHVINAKSSAQYNKTLEALNSNNPHEAIRAMFKESNLGMPSIIVQHMKEPGFGVNKAADFSVLERHFLGMNDRLSAIEKNTKPTKQYVGVGNGYIEIDGAKKTHHKP